MNQLDRIEKALEAMRADLAELVRRGEYSRGPDTALSLEAAAERLDVKLGTLRAMVKRGKLLTVVISKRPKVPASEIARLLTPKPQYREERRSGRGRAAAAPSSGKLDAYLKGLRKKPGL